MRLITGCRNLAADASSNVAKAKCLLVAHGRATWGYKVVSPNCAGRSRDTGSAATRLAYKQAVSHKKLYQGMAVDHSITVPEDV